MYLLVIDSHSPDGTWKIVAQKAKKSKNVVLLDEGKKGGLGVAYNHGFTYAIQKLKADGIMEMDADFQHNPLDVPRFVAEFDRGADYVVGARNISGGSLPKDWGLGRKFLSVVGNWIYRIGLLMPDIHDFTTGFRLARVKGFLDSVDFAVVFSRKSFTYKTWLLYEVKKRGGKVVEIPINFSLRETGDSKMTTNNIFDSLKLIVDIWQARLSL
jgi:dolichol-phosphate mannosyltransferase